MACGCVKLKTSHAFEVISHKILWLVHAFPQTRTNRGTGWYRYDTSVVDTMGGGPAGPPGALHIPSVPRPYRVIGTAMQSVMWFWIFYRAKQDGAALLVNVLASLIVASGGWLYGEFGGRPWRVVV
jgi:hypothetical protein